MNSNEPTDERRPTATPHEWIGLVKRARLGSSRAGQARKLALIIFGSYADTGSENGRAPGEHVHCGVARLAMDLECGLSTAQRHLAWMRSTGLIEKTANGNARRGLADEYRLTLPTPDQAEAMGITDPTTYKERVGDLTRANKEKQRRSLARVRACARPESDLTKGEVRSGTKEGVRSGPDAGRSDLSKSEVRSADQTSVRCESDLTYGEVPPSLDNTDPVYSTEPEVVDLRTDLAVPRARGREDQISREGGGTAPPAAKIEAHRIPGQSVRPAERELTDAEKVGLATQGHFCPACYLVGKFTPSLAGSTSCSYHAVEVTA